MMEAPDSFTAVAPYYDELMKPVPYRMWVSYYLLLLAQQGMRVRRVLDVCCGTGTMCQMLQAEGLQMSGIDLSAPMIEQARAKALRRNLPIRYEVADASSFDLGARFDAAYSFFDSLNNILEPALLQAAFGCVRRHLETGGSWIFDVNTAYAFETQLFDQKNLRKNAKLQYDWHGSWDPGTKLIRVDMKFWREGREFTETHYQRAYGDEEIRSMLALAGFVDVRAFHSYTLDPPRERSDRVHYLCRAS